MEMRLCPFCSGEIPLTVNLCIHCGRELQSMKVSRPYQIVRDGPQYGISYHGQIKLHGLELKRAIEMEAILNMVLGDEKIG